VIFVIFVIFMILMGTVSSHAPRQRRSTRERKQIISSSGATHHSQENAINENSNEDKSTGQGTEKASQQDLAGLQRKRQSRYFCFA
jgi:hypothetical protein